MLLYASLILQAVVKSIVKEATVCYFIIRGKTHFYHRSKAVKLSEEPGIMASFELALNLQQLKIA